MEWFIVLALALGVPLAIAGLTRRPGQTVSERSAEIGDALQSTGSGISRMGCGLTLVVTVPLLGFAFFGLIGLVVGLAIGILLATVMFRPAHA